MKSEDMRSRKKDEGIIEVWETAPEDAGREEVLRQAERVARQLVTEKMEEEFGDDLEEEITPLQPVVARSGRKKGRKQSE